MHIIFLAVIELQYDQSFTVNDDIIDDMIGITIITTIQFFD